MLTRLGVACEITASATKIEQAKKIILPGNGAFDACMQELRNTGLIPLLEQKVLLENTPILGICVGAQMLAHSSEEGVEKGLGWIDMQVKRFPPLPDLRVPNMGWRAVKPRSSFHCLTQEMSEETRFYFVHSYYMKPTNTDDILLSSTYGIDFAAAVSVKNIVGVQFHPEKSHHFGKQLLERFAKEF
jgi:glutamine amidotransferase